MHEDLIHDLQNRINDSGFEDSNIPAKYNPFGHVGHWMTVHAIRSENNAYSCLLLEKKNQLDFLVSLLKAFLSILPQQALSGN